ncbi:MAG: glycosyltransferase [Prevotellaceae bacterium]|jgi:cellulose synthase/poly-beta-1,6-N-acetylglucosamine synthase-like glycosyltransferase|nr:glycosyltransferase [Prevotellaceae bacterium]
MISVVISIYKRLDMLNLILQALSQQSYTNFEVIVAEDNDAAETADFIRSVHEKYTYSLKHVCQKDAGFRKTAILNKALRIAEGEQFVFLDGDCIPHRHLLHEYSKAICGNVMCYGRRLFLSKSLSEKLLKTESIKGLNIWTAILYCSKSVGAGIYLPWKKNTHKQNRVILGCNWGIERAALFSINGFDEDYQRAGRGEDFDVEWRLIKKAYRKISMKNKAIVYHIFHPANYSDADTLYVQDLMMQKMEAGNVYCLNGLEKTRQPY